MNSGALLAVTVVLLVQVVLVTATPLRIGAFNLQVFGASKSSQNSTVSVISQIIRRYDIILLQEIRDVTETHIHNLLALVNSQEPVYTYNIVVGPRLGRSNIYKEQYAYVYRSETVRILESYTYNDTNDEFEREPMVVLISDMTVNPISDLVLIGIHIRPNSSDTEREINALVSVYEEAVMRYNTTNVIILGDMNADCSYLSNKKYNRLTFTNDSRFLWLIGKENDTTVADSDCAYDRFVVTREVYSTLVQGSVLIYLFEHEHDLTQAQAMQVSDHYPIELQLEGILN